MKIIQLSDTHFSKGNNLLFGQINTEECFDLLIPEINKHNPDYIFVTGDISQDGSPESYLKIKEKLSQFNCPKYVIPGNHDNFDNLSYLLDDNIFYTDYLDIKNYRFIFINTQKPGSDSGIIKSEEISKIDRLLDNRLNNIIILHHHFLPTNTIIDDYIIENHLEFVSFLQKHNNTIKAIFHGHVHNAYQTFIPMTNICTYACPATCVQFALSRELKLNYNIGFRELVIDEFLNTFPHLF